MATTEPTDPIDETPARSRARSYVATIVLAIVMIALLWLLTVNCNVPLGSVR